MQLPRSQVPECLMMTMICNIAEFTDLVGEGFEYKSLGVGGCIAIDFIVDDLSRAN